MLWTPSILFLDSSGKERYRVEGYLPRDEFAAQIHLALGRISFMSKKWAEAEQHYNSIVNEYGKTASAAEAVYWAGVAYYKKTNDHTVLGRVGQQLAQTHADSLWAKKASVWVPAEPKAKSA